MKYDIRGVIAMTFITVAMMASHTCAGHTTEKAAGTPKQPIVPQTVTSTPEKFNTIVLPDAPKYGWIQNFDLYVMDSEVPPKVWIKGGSLTESFPAVNVVLYNSTYAAGPVAGPSEVIDPTGELHSPDTWSCESNEDLTQPPFSLSSSQWLAKFDQIWTYTAGGKSTELNYYRGVWYVYTQDDHIQRGAYNHRNPVGNT